MQGGAIYRPYHGLGSAMRYGFGSAMR